MTFRQGWPLIAHSAKAWFSLKVSDPSDLNISNLVLPVTKIKHRFCLTTGRCDDEDDHHDSECVARGVVPEEVAVIFALQTVKRG